MEVRFSLEIQDKVKKILVQLIDDVFIKLQ
jgi:hypothetical protein